MKNFILWLARLFTVGFVGLSASVALALPSPADIDKAVGAGQFSQAESMLREVIAEKPQSAKAHYQLAQVLDRQSRYADAKKELVRAREIDPTLKFAASAERFNELFDKTSAAAAGAGSTRAGGVVSSGLQAPPPAAGSAVPASSGASASASAGASGSQGVSINYILIGVGILGLLALVLWRVSQSSQRQAPAAYGMTPAPAGGAVGGGVGSQFGPGPGAYPYGGAPAGGGSTMTGAVVGGLAGVAAGYALSKALDGDHHSSAQSSMQPGGQSNQFEPIAPPAAPQDFGSFDSGSGSGWDDRGSSGGDFSGGDGGDW
jgi:hypothetical protein